MSVSFWLVGADPHCNPRNFECNDCWDQEPNLASVNARELLEALNQDNEELAGQARARDLVPFLERLAKAQDPGLPSSVEGRFINCGRQEGYLQKRAAELLKICQKAGDLGVISWA